MVFVQIFSTNMSGFVDQIKWFLKHKLCEIFETMEL